MSTDSELISRQILKLIGERDITINRLATLSNIGQSSIDAIIKGSSASPKIGTLKKISDGLGLSLLEFLDLPPYNTRPDGSSPKNTDQKWDELGKVLTPEEKVRIRKILLDDFDDKKET